MTRDEMKTVKVGDTLMYRGSKFDVVQVEKDYDYSTTPPTPFTWAAHTSEGLSVQIDDSWLKQVKLIAA